MRGVLLAVLEFCRVARCTAVWVNGRAVPPDDTQVKAAVVALTALGVRRLEMRFDYTLPFGRTCTSTERFLMRV